MNEKGAQKRGREEKPGGRQEKYLHNAFTSILDDHIIISVSVVVDVYLCAVFCSRYMQQKKPQ